ncbi:MAG: AmmeMemoRadiSam system protein A, partial [Elusimicrobia bacterium]|nr:AmmeMemoRadiSam system protein A [Elusimicrobiota bacterium]
ADHKNSTKESVVGYVSGVFAKSKNTNGYKTILSEEQKKILLDEARKSIISYINGNRNIIDNTLSDIPEFNLPKAVFVTINENGYLRGCIGSTEPVLLLNDAVKYFALSAAFGDRRFKPLEKGEINKIKIEISILSPLKEINDYKKIREKVDGVMVSSSKGNGLFLPQVWDYFDKKEDFLNQLCTEKAGLDKNCWKDKETKLFIFQVEKISE